MFSLSRNAPVPDENRWLPGADEVALFFSMTQSNSALTRRLHVPAGARAYLWQNEKIIEAPAGEEEAEGYFSKLKTLVQGQRVELLIARHNTFAIECEFDDLHSAEFMKIAASFSLAVRIDQVDAFARQFMGRPGVVSCRHLQQLLAPALRAIALEFFAAQSLRELQAQSDLRRQLDARLLAGLNAGIGQYGLAVTQVNTLQIRHDKLCAEKEKLGEKIGTLWLIVDGKRAQLEHGKRLDALYSIGEWQKIAHEEQQIRVRYRREEMRQKFGKDLAWLYLQGQREDAKKRLARAQLKQDENERMQVIRARELELYGRIAESATRKEAIARGAGDSIRELEHAQKDKAEQRQNAADQWLHVRTMARIKMRSESALTELEGKQAAQALQQKMEQQRQKNQLEHQMAQARLIEEQAQAQAQTRAQAQAQARAQTQALQQQQEQADALAAHEKLLRTLQLHASFEQQAQQQRHQAGIDQLEAEKQRLILRQEEEQARWQREQQSAHAGHAHQVLLERMAIERIGVIASLSETGKVATADWPNAAALADILKLQAQAGMSAEQILATQAGLSQHAAQAMSAIATTQQGMTSAQAIALLQERLREDRAYSERQAEQELRHQLDLALAQHPEAKRSASPGQTGRK